MTVPSTGQIVLNKSCPLCGSRPLAVAWGLRAKKIGDFSLSGAQMKISAVEFCEISCSHCGMWAPGRFTDDTKIEDGTFVSGHFEVTGSVHRPNGGR